MIIPQQEIDKAFIKWNNDYLVPHNLKFDDDGFKAGIAFAESKIEEISLEFARYYYHEFNEEFNEGNLFKEFLKQKNEEVNR